MRRPHHTRPPGKISRDEWGEGMGKCRGCATAPPARHERFVQIFLRYLFFSKIFYKQWMALLRRGCRPISPRLFSASLLQARCCYCCTAVLCCCLVPELLWTHARDPCMLAVSESSWGPCCKLLEKVNDIYAEGNMSFVARLCCAAVVGLSCSPWLKATTTAFVLRPSLPAQQLTPPSRHGQGTGTSMNSELQRCPWENGARRRRRRGRRPELSRFAASGNLPPPEVTERALHALPDDLLQRLTLTTVTVRTVYILLSRYSTRYDKHRWFRHESVSYAQHPNVDVYAFSLFHV